MTTIAAGTICSWRMLAGRSNGFSRSKPSGLRLVLLWVESSSSARSRGSGIPFTSVDCNRNCPLPSPVSKSPRTRRRHLAAEKIERASTAGTPAPALELIDVDDDSQGDPRVTEKPQLGLANTVRNPVADKAVQDGIDLRFREAGGFRWHRIEIAVGDHLIDFFFQLAAFVDGCRFGVDSGTIDVDRDYTAEDHDGENFAEDLAFSSMVHWCKLLPKLPGDKIHGAVGDVISIVAAVLFFAPRSPENCLKFAHAGFSLNPKSMEFNYLRRLNCGLALAPWLNSRQLTQEANMIFDLITYGLLASIFVVNTLRMFYEKPKNALQSAPVTMAATCCVGARIQNPNRASFNSICRSGGIHVACAAYILPDQLLF